jgi:hypothetical protein
LIAQKHLFPSQEPDVTRILPSGWRSMTIEALSEIAKRSRTFSSVSVPLKLLVSPSETFDGFCLEIDRQQIPARKLLVWLRNLRRILRRNRQAANSGSETACMAQ